MDQIAPATLAAANAKSRTLRELVRAPEIRQELRSQVVRPLHQPLTKPVGRKLGGFFRR